MRALLVVSILALTLLTVACSPHRGWYGGGCGYWNGSAYDSSYPAQSYGPGYEVAAPYAGSGH